MKKLAVLTLVILALVIVMPVRAVHIPNNTWFKTVTGMTNSDTDGYALAFHPNYVDNHTVYAATWEGIYGSTDGGQTWSSSIDDATYFKDTTVFSLTANLSMPSGVDLFAGTANSIHYRPYNGSWVNKTGVNYSGLQVDAITVDPGYPLNHTVYVSSWTDGVFKTTNFDSIHPTWARVGTVLVGQRVWSLIFSPNYSSDPNGGLFAAVDKAGGSLGGVYELKKGQSDWTQLTSGINSSHMGVKSIALSPYFNTDRTIFAGLDAGDGVYKSTDAGAHWSGPLPSTENLYVQTLAASFDVTGGRMIVFAGTSGDGVYVSPNGGASWSALNDGLTGSKEINVVTVAPGNSMAPFQVFAGIMSNGVWQMQYSPPQSVFLPLVIH